MENNITTQLLQIVNEFYHAENLRDWNSVANLLSEDVVCTTYPAGETTSGKEEYLKGMLNMYKNRDSTFNVTSICADATARTVHSELIIEGKRSVNVFEICNGLICVEREYLGDGYNNDDCDKSI